MSVMGSLASLMGGGGSGQGLDPDELQADPFTGMSLAQSSTPKPPPGPTAADAYRMGGLASMSDYNETPPHEVFGAYDKALNKLDRRQTALEATPQGRAMLAAQQAFPGAQQRGPLAGVAEFAKDLVVPQTPFDYATSLVMPLKGVSIGAKIAAAAGGALLDAGEAHAGKGRIPKALGGLVRGAEDAATGVKNWKLGDIAAEPPNAAFNVVPEGAREYTRRYAPAFEMGDVTNAGLDAPTNRLIQTVRDPHRMMFPGVYANPREIAAEAARHVVPEDPAMKQLWGVSRGDLDEMAVGRVGNEAPKGIKTVANPNGSEAASNIMTPRNEARLQDALYEAGRVPGLKHADAWYIMDPVYQRLEQMFGPEEAVQRFRHLNTMMGMASPSSPVLEEIQRGTAAHWLQQQGRWDDVLKQMPLGEPSRGASFPDDLRYIKSHLHFRNASAEPMGKYLQRGELLSEKPKVPLYVHASGVPETGFQTSAPVGDAHWSRSVGLADTRTGPSNVGAAFTRPEYQQLAPWWRDKIAAPLGIESVPAQARMWTAMGPQTGINSPLGAGKLELLSQQIVKAAKRLNVSPETARDLVLSGGAGAGAVTLAPKIGDLAAPDRYSN